MHKNFNHILLNIKCYLLFRKHPVASVISWTILLLTMGIISLSSVFLMIRLGFFGPLPTEETLSGIENNQASDIYAAEGEYLGSYYFENRTNVPLSNIPSHLIHALVATEDTRFYQHNGIDYRAWGRVFFKTLLMADRSAGGGSTITQQLAKNLYPRENTTMAGILIAKIKEVIIARRLERVYPKEKILELYLNTVSFGENTYGIGKAARRFFSTYPSQLTMEQAAMLVGMLKATSAYNPRDNKDKATARRNTVLMQMKRYDYISEQVHDSLVDLPLELNYTRLTHNEGPAPYFREELRQFMLDWCKNNTNEAGEPYNLYTDGLKIYTTIDLKMQVLAEEAVNNHMQRLQKMFFRHWRSLEPWDRNPAILEYAIKQTARYQKYKDAGLTDDSAVHKFNGSTSFAMFNYDKYSDTTVTAMDSLKYYLKILHAGFASMETETGKIKSWVGGIDHKYFQYDHVTSRRQPGSVFKPVVYATALESGASPCNFYANDSMVYEAYDNWTPANADYSYGGEYSMKGAIANSVNTVAVKLLFESGIPQVKQMAKKLGIVGDIPDEPSIALGTASVSLLELLSAYSVFANGGFAVTPYYVQRIEDSDGKVLESFKTQRSNQRIIEERTAVIMNEMLQHVVNTGTGSKLRSLYGLDQQIAGKTGTTQNQSDGWFIGYTQKLVAGVWVGAEIPSVHFRTLSLGQGSHTALPIWGNFFGSILKNKDYNRYTRATFSVPTDSIWNLLDCEDFREIEEENVFDELFRNERSLRDIIRDIFGRKNRD